MARFGIAAMGSRLGQSGGVDIYTAELVEALATHKTGHDFVVLVYADRLNEWQFRSWPNSLSFVSLTAVAGHSLLAKQVLRLRRWLGCSIPPQQGPDYLAHQIDALQLDFVHFPRTLIYPLSLRTPCILTFFDMQHEYYPEFFTPSEIAERTRTYPASVDKARHIIAPSTYTRQTLHEKYGTSISKISVLPVGIPDNLGRVSADEVARVRARYVLPEHFVFYPANPWPHKNHAHLMAALRIYRDRYGSPPHLVLSGRLPEEPRAAEPLAIAAGIKDYVHDLGFVPTADMPALYTAADALVFPSLFEGFGIPVLEAFACGCPVAAANTTAIPECAQEAALLFDPLDPSAIAASLHQLLTEPELIADLTAKGYARSRQYTWSNLVPQLIQIYENTLQETN